MASKEATIYIVDVGKSMGEKHSGRHESDLDWSLRWVWDKITATVATGRKTAMAGVIGLRTDGTENPMSEEEDYAHISVLQSISQILMPTVRELRENLVASKTNEGDAISAIILAVQLIVEHCKKLKFIRKIYLVTNGRGRYEAAEEDLAGIASKLKEDAIELTVLGVDFDDEEYGFKEENKSKSKASNEVLLRNLTEQCEGTFGTLSEAIAALGVPRIKQVNPVPTYRGVLTLGDLENFDTAMTIDIERFPRIMVNKPPSASSFVLRGDTAPESSAQSSITLKHEEDNPNDALAAVKRASSYQVKDENAPDGKRDVPQEELDKGYEYGSTAVHINESERNITDLDDLQPSLDIIGFVPKDNFARHFAMSRSSTIIAQRANDKASLALSSFIHALHELDTYAIARFVKSAKTKPVVLVLAPEIEPDYECLIDVELPFAEDIRRHRFPPLDRVITVSGKTITEHRNLPSKDLMQAMSDYVDEMDLSSAGRDEDGDVCEFATMDQTFSPALHAINQNIQWRAARGGGGLAPLPEILTKYANPPDDLVEKTKSALETLIKAGDVKRVPPKQKSKKRSRETEKPLSGLNIDELLRHDREKRPKKEIRENNAIPDYKQLLETTSDTGGIKEASVQFGEIIKKYIMNSTGGSGYERAVESIRVMREQVTDLEEPNIYNDFIRELKGLILKGKLGGDRTDMWLRIRNQRLGLLDKKQSARANVTEEEAREFYRVH